MNFNRLRHGRVNAKSLSDTEVINMEDYKEMYETMVRASKKAMNLLIDAQRKCEEMYLAAEEEEKN